MIVKQYGVTYHRVLSNHLETLRYWRNQSYIRETMQFKEYITPLMQKKWFDKINNPYNYYFIIEHQGKKIGLINCKDTDKDSRLAEGGIFIWDTDYWGTSIPVFASLTMLEAVFEIFKSGDASVATVAVDNKKALDFNLMLGYEIKETSSDGKWYKLYLTKERYRTHCSRLIKAARILHKDDADFEMIGGPNEIQAEQINQYFLNNIKS